MGRKAEKPQGAPLPLPMEWHWTVEEIAVHHRMSRDAVRSAIEREELKAICPAKAYLVPDSWYREWVRGSAPVSFFSK